MLRRLLLIAGILVAIGCTPRPARAQFIGFTSPQTVQQQLANNVNCTGAAQLFTIQNLGQNQHFASVTVTGISTPQLTMMILGIDAAGNSYRISDQLITAGLTSTGVLYGTGYYPIVQISVTCSATGAFTLLYSGTSANSPQISGSYQQTQQSKRVFTGADADANQDISFQTPFGDADGLLTVGYALAANANSTLAVRCSSDPAPITTAEYTFPIAAVTTAQFFRMPPNKCQFVRLIYTDGGGAPSGALLGVQYDFIAPSTGNAEAANYTHIAGTTATVAKATKGVVTSLTIGTPAAGTVTLHDLAAAACVAVPATEIVSVLTAIAGASPSSHEYNLFFRNGICVKASAAMDLTVGTQ